MLRQCQRRTVATVSIGNCVSRWFTSGEKRPIQNFKADTCTTRAQCSMLCHHRTKLMSSMNDTFEFVECIGKKFCEKKWNLNFRMLRLTLSLSLAPSLSLNFFLILRIQLSFSFYFWPWQVTQSAICAKVVSFEYARACAPCQCSIYRASTHIRHSIVSFSIRKRKTFRQIYLVALYIGLLGLVDASESL